MTVGRSVVMLNSDTRLFPHHTDPARRFDFTAPTAEVCPNPADPAVLGVRNLSSRPWRCIAASGSAYHVSSGHAFRLSSGCTIDFGNARGRVGAAAGAEAPR
jgi:hypothetical protein